MIIDPTYDTKTYRELISDRKSKLKFTALTHYHADFLSGHTEFDVPIIMGPHGKNSVNKFDVKEHSDESSIELGCVKIKVLHTPGHTNESTCFLLTDAKGSPSCIFTGDTLLINDVGRPDFSA